MGHGHGHHHHHHHAWDNENANMGLAFFLNLGFAVIELVGGLLTNSVAILSDALHDIGDALAIGLSWWLHRFSKKRADTQFSYGFQRFSLLGAIINGMILVAGSVLILTEAIPRLWQPEQPYAPGMLGLAVLGILVNGAAALRLRGSESLNAKMIGLHLLEDVLGWVAVLVVSVLLLFFDWPILDPLLSIAFTLFILYNVVQSLRSTIAVFLQAVPRDVDLQQVKQSLEALPNVDSSHHTHVWSLDGQSHVITAHLSLSKAPNESELAGLKQRIAKLVDELGFAHSTIELEYPEDACRISEPKPE